MLLQGIGGLQIQKAYLTCKGRWSLHFPQRGKLNSSLLDLLIEFQQGCMTRRGLKNVALQIQNHLFTKKTDFHLSAQFTGQLGKPVARLLARHDQVTKANNNKEQENVLRQSFVLKFERLKTHQQPHKSSQTRALTLHRPCQRRYSKSTGSLHTKRLFTDNAYKGVESTYKIYHAS